VLSVIAEQIRTLAEDAASGTERITETLHSSASHIDRLSAAVERVSRIASEVLHYQGAIVTAAEQHAMVLADVAERAHRAISRARRDDTSECRSVRAGPFVRVLIAPRASPRITQQARGPRLLRTPVQRRHVQVPAGAYGV
jgi:hypothetical protein